MTVAVASKNPAKLLAVRLAFEAAFQFPVAIEPVSAPSEVPDQPMTDEETRQGAFNRVRNARKIVPEANYWAGIEGGVQPNTGGGMDAFGWVVIASPQQESIARSASFPLPPAVVHQIRKGGELGHIMDELFDEKNSKQKGGAVGLLTNGLVTREALYQQPLLLALIPFMQPDLY